jgi:hypothetical protein
MYIIFTENPIQKDNVEDFWEAFVLVGSITRIQLADLQVQRSCFETQPNSV